MSRWLRKLLPYTTASLILALIYLAWVSLSRHLANREMERAGEARRAHAYRGLAEPGGTELKILQFYASPGELKKGKQAILCYGVENARAVRIDPPVEQLEPVRNRCFWVAPQRTTTYSLEAEGAGGRRVTASFTLQVRR